LEKEMQTADLHNDLTREWSRFMITWLLCTSLIYISLIVAILTLVMPAAEPNPRGDMYFELMAAGHAPILYRFTIMIDVSAWIAIAGVLVGFAALLRHRAPIRGSLVMLLAAGLWVGFVGACLRLAGTSHLADEYLSSSATQQDAVVRSYDHLLLVINILFSAGGLLGGIALVLIASAASSLPELPRWSTVLLGIAGTAHIAKGVVELATGADLGPLALLASTLIAVALVAISRKLHSSR
jgi:hypothetical protein